MSAAISVPSLPTLEHEATALAAIPVSFQITDTASYLYAGEQFTRASRFLKAIAEEFAPIDRHQIDARNATIALRKRFEAPAVAIRDAASKATGAWEAEQRRRAAESARLAQQERERLEANALAEAGREQARLTAQAEELALSAALAAEQRGDTALAEKIITAPVVTPTIVPRAVFTPPPAVQAAPKLDGVAFRDTWTFEVTDEALVPRTYLTLDLVRIGQVVRAMKDQTDIPGIRAVNRRAPINAGGRG